MCDASKKPKLRNTRNSQRLFNLQQQELLYKQLGISAMSTHHLPKKGDEKEGSEGEVEDQPEDEENQDSEGEHSEQEESPKEKTIPDKKGKKNKRAHSMSSG